MNKKWYENTLFILIMLIVFFPLGFYLIYRNHELRKELMPYAIAIGLGIVLIIGYVFIFGDHTAPELKVESTKTYQLNADFSPETLITDYVVSVSDNKTDLAKEDVQIKNYKKLDFTKVGTQKIEFLVTDDDYNNTVETANLVINK